MNTSRIELVSTSPKDTQRIAVNLLKQLHDQSVIALHGELGSGKTCFTKGIARGLQVKQPVTSPTFKIINEYDGTRQLCHIDLYRLENAGDSQAIGLEDYLDSNAIVAIEWPDRATNLLPPSTVHVYLRATENPGERIILIENLPGTEEQALKS